MINIFVSYAHADKELKDELEKHLIIMQRNGLILPWVDNMIIPGQEWDKSISDSMNNADLIVCLISPDFLSSKYCYEIEMQNALQRHEEKKALVIPIILRYCEWMTTPFSSLQALPTLGRPIKDWQDQDHAFYDVIEGLKKTIAMLLNPGALRELTASQNAGIPDDDKRKVLSDGKVNSDDAQGPQTPNYHQPPAFAGNKNIFVFGGIGLAVVFVVAIMLLFSRHNHRRDHLNPENIASVPAVAPYTGNNVPVINAPSFKAASLSNVTFKRGEVDGSFVFQGGKIWTQYFNNRKSLLNEINRDEWSVYLKDAAGTTIFQLDLSSMAIYFTPGGAAKAQFAVITAAYPIEQK